ncbi:MAG: arsenate reductase (azurin) small subunit [Caldimonas sp.]
MSIKPDCGCTQPCDAQRRAFIKVGAGTLSAGVAYAIAPMPAYGAEGAGSPSSPTVNVTPLDAVRENTVLPFSYPDTDSPAVLLRLKGPAQGGVGPGSSIVAFSVLCTHKGCPVSYRPEHKLLICPCHWSTFDPVKGGQMVIGQGSQALPQIELRVKDGVIQAIGINGLIYGRQTNIL